MDKLPSRALKATDSANRADYFGSSTVFYLAGQSTLSGQTFSGTRFPVSKNVYNRFLDKLGLI